MRTVYKLMYQTPKKIWRTCSIEGEGVKRAATPYKEVVEANKVKMAKNFPHVTYAILELEI